MVSFPKAGVTGNSFTVQMVESQIMIRKGAEVAKLPASHVEAGLSKSYHTFAFSASAPLLFRGKLKELSIFCISLIWWELLILPAG
jgi:hypothetical protein